jgi:hypothetical protein
MDKKEALEKDEGVKISKKIDTKPLGIECEEKKLSDSYEDYEIAKKLINLKQSADSRGIEFNLSFKVVKGLLKTKKCFYTGVLFVEDGGVNHKTIDRVDASKGYVDDNVVACTFEINQKKKNLTCEDIFNLAEKIKKFKK